MKKNKSLVVSALLGIVLASSSIVVHEIKAAKNTESTQAILASSDYLGARVADDSTETSIVLSQAAGSFSSQKAAVQDEVQETLAANAASEKKVTEASIPTTVTVSVKPKTKTIASRGAAPKVTAAASTSNKTSSANDGAKFSGKNTELLDWWKSGNSAFPIGSVVTVKDVKTGKTFKIKRTMGSNHADCEALTLEDAQIIKGIWGGFNWNTRPIHILINGRVLAASMSSLPHAGVDSAPAFATVSNRSEGYGVGQNLDTVKGNGMNGHFDVHFLNSTRHKDGKVDPNHQAAIKTAASK